MIITTFKIFKGEPEPWIDLDPLNVRYQNAAIEESNVLQNKTSDFSTIINELSLVGASLFCGHSQKIIELMYPFIGPCHHLPVEMQQCLQNALDIDSALELKNCMGLCYQDGSIVDNYLFNLDKYVETGFDKLLQLLSSDTKHIIE